MELTHYLNEHPLVGVAVITSLFLGFISGFLCVGKIMWANIGTFSAFFKRGKYYILKNVVAVGDTREEKKIYVFQEVKIKNYHATYSRKFYLRRDSKFSMPGEDFKEDIIFKVEEIEKNIHNRISSLLISFVKIEMSSNLPTENLVLS